MQDYSKLVEDLRHGVGYWYMKNSSRLVSILNDAATAIEALQAELGKEGKRVEHLLATVNKLEDKMPKRGEWELIDGAEPMRWGCSRCKYMSWETSAYCPRCGAKMEVQE